MATYEPFGQVAVRLGFCDQETIERALEIQRNLKAEDKEHKLIGMILLELRALSTTQLIEVLQYYEHSDRVPLLEDELAAE